MAMEYETIPVSDLPPHIFQANRTGLNKALRELPLGQALFVPRDKAVRMELMRNRVVGAVNKVKKEIGNDSHIWHTTTDNVKGGFWVWREE